MNWAISEASAARASDVEDGVHPAEFGEGAFDAFFFLQVTGEIGEPERDTLRFFASGYENLPAVLSSELGSGGGDAARPGNQKSLGTQN